MNDDVSSLIIVSQQSFTTEFTSDGIHQCDQSETVRHLGSIRKEEEE